MEPAPLLVRRDFRSFSHGKRIGCRAPFPRPGLHRRFGPQRHAWPGSPAPRTIEFGTIELAKEECREARSANLVASLLQDIRFGIRMLGKSWGLTLVIAITLALGIGVNTAIFSVLNGWLLRPLPVRAPEQIVVLASQQKDLNSPQFSYSELDYVQQHRSRLLQVMCVPLLSGRSISDSDNETARPVAIVNQTMAKRLWPKEDPIGKRFSLQSSAGSFIQVVGIAADGLYLFLSAEPQPYFYLPLAQNYSSFQSLQVRSSIPPEQLSSQIQEQIRALDPDLPTMDVRSMKEIVLGLAGFFVFRLAASLAAAMGMLGLILALVGVYGVVTFSVSQRTREIGIRMALGAKGSQILKLVLGQGVNLMIAGVIAGSILALLLARAIAKLLIGISAADPATYLVVTASSVTLLACWIPARRAMRVDPLIALRHE